jgi:hypothetical protein
MSEQPQWLAGLTRIAEGVWRDDETGLEVRVEGYVATVYPWPSLPEAPTVSAINGGVRVFIGDMEVLGPETALRFAAALTIAARLARAYNETGGA